MKKTVLWTLATKCNQHCAYCYYTQENRTANDTISCSEKLKKISSIRPDLIYLSGEPTVYKHTKRIIEYLDKNEIDVVFTTNGLSFTKEWISFINRTPCVKAVLFSLDGHSEYTHNYFRSNFAKVSNNIKRFSQQKNEHIKLGITSVVSKVNIDSLEHIAQYAETLGCHYLHFQPLYGMPEYALSASEIEMLVAQIKRLRKKHRSIQFSSDNYVEALSQFAISNTFQPQCKAGVNFHFLSENNELKKCPSPFLEENGCIPSINCINIIELVNSSFVKM